MNKKRDKNEGFPSMGNPLFLCQNITMNEVILFNLWGFIPNYKSASDGIMLDMLLKSMEERENGVFNQSGVKSADGAVRTGI